MAIEIKKSAEYQNENTIATRLNSIEWDFQYSNKSRRSIHSFHSYPAKFIPEIPKTLIRELSPPKNTIVLDPFCGCGTTLVEAQLAGYDSIGIDLNPIGCLISQVKTTPLPPDFLSAVEICLNKSRKNSNIQLPNIPNLSHWFRPDISEALASIIFSIRTTKDPIIKKALEAVFSSIIVRVSNQDSDTRYAAVAKPISQDKVYDIFNEAAQTLYSHALTLPGLLTAKASIINRNILDVQVEDISSAVGLVITSPPYPNAYEYWLYHKYRMWWLGHDPLTVKSHEIGARAHFFSRRIEKEDFQEQMSSVFRLLNGVMREGSYCCFVVGDSKIHGKVVNNADILIRAAAEYGFKLAYMTDRLINPNRKSFNLSHARIKREHILIWER